MGTKIQRIWQYRPPNLLVVILFLLGNIYHTLALNNVQSVQYLLRNFNYTRSNQGAFDSKQKARSFIRDTLKKQGFTTESKDFRLDGVLGINVIGRKNGLFYNTNRDRILIVGAYYDTYKTSPGANAGGSGLAAMLHVARQYQDKDHSCFQNHTIIFVAFDQSQQCSCGNFTCCYYGSRAFAKDIAEEFRDGKGKGEILGAIILGSIMNFDQSVNSQNFTHLQSINVDLSIKDTVAAIGRDGNRGDFILSIGRQDGDTYLLKNFTKYYNKGANSDKKFKLREFTWALQEQPDKLGSKAKHAYQDLFNGDHYSFWNNDPMVNAIFITDTAKLRGYMKYCYRNDCDTIEYMTPTRGQFIANIAESVATMARNLSGLGECTVPLFGNITKKLTGESGEIQSPGYPKQYPNRADSVWYITVPAKFAHVEITFPEFELEEHECTNDYVDIFDGFPNGDLLGHYCGSSPPHSPPKEGIRSTGRYMQVVFKSDQFDTYKGFRATWKGKGSILKGMPIYLITLLAILVHVWT